MKISACIIAKNEEKNLPRLLKSIKGKFDEIILVDTGSTDKTIEIARSYGCKVFQKEWKGFANARNYASSKAKGDWIWHFDADFELEDEEYRKALFYLKKVPSEYDSVMIGVKNINENKIVLAYSFQIFIHRNKPYIKWEGKVHECVNTPISYGIPVFVNHYGYQDKDVLRQKAIRNLKLLKEEMKKLDKNSPSYLFKLFYVIQSYIVILDNKKKEDRKKLYSLIEEYLTLRKKLDDVIKRKPDVFDNHIISYGLSLAINQKDFEKAENFLNDPIAKSSDYPDIIFYEILLKSETGDFKQAVEKTLKLTNILQKNENNIFSEGSKKVIESATKYNIVLSKFESIISDLSKEEISSILSKAEDIFKNTKGEFTGILYYTVLKHVGKEKANKLLTKLSRISQNKMIKMIIAVEMIKNGYKEKAKKILQTSLIN